jgi:hypothetical protein
VAFISKWEICKFLLTSFGSNRSRLEKSIYNDNNNNLIIELLLLYVIWLKALKLRNRAFGHSNKGF